jgi:hypothetical protein
LEGTLIVNSAGVSHRWDWRLLGTIRYGGLSPPAISS